MKSSFYYFLFFVILISRNTFAQFHTSSYLKMKNIFWENRYAKFFWAGSSLIRSMTIIKRREKDKKKREEAFEELINKVLLDIKNTYLKEDNKAEWAAWAEGKFTPHIAPFIKKEKKTLKHYLIRITQTKLFLIYGRYMKKKIPMT